MSHTSSFFLALSIACGNCFGFFSDIAAGLLGVFFANVSEVECAVCVVSGCERLGRFWALSPLSEEGWRWVDVDDDIERGIADVSSSARPLAP